MVRARLAKENVPAEGKNGARAETNKTHAPDILMRIAVVIDVAARGLRLRTQMN